MTNFADMHILAHNIVRVVEKKDADYGSSWKARGGVGAFMMAARKWDRIENMVKQSGYDIFSVLGSNRGDIADDIDDLIGYLLLIRENCLRAKPVSNATEAQRSAGVGSVLGGEVPERRSFIGRREEPQSAYRADVMAEMAMLPGNLAQARKGENLLYDPGPATQLPQGQGPCAPGLRHL